MDTVFLVITKNSPSNAWNHHDVSSDRRPGASVMKLNGSSKHAKYGKVQNQESPSTCSSDTENRTGSFEDTRKNKKKNSGNVQNKDSSFTGFSDTDNKTESLKKIQKNQNKDNTKSIQKLKKRSYKRLEKEESQDNQSQSLKRAKRSKPAFICCSENIDLSYSSSNLLCNSGFQDCRIHPDDHFWIPHRQNGEFQEAICDTCFDYMENKKGWRKKINTNEKMEEVFTCQSCSGLWHQCCSFFYGEPEEFMCRNCAPESYKLFLDTSGSSPDSDFIEERINGFLENALERNQKFQKISVRTYFNPEDYAKTEDLAPSSWEEKFIRKYGNVVKYGSRAIHVFQQQDGVDQIFFSIFASEYRDPVRDGKSWLVIDCLDSIKLFQPASLRTQIYRELILSYFHLARSMELQNSFLWADPPLHGDDYVFNIKPANQKTPKKMKLQNWYIKMMEKGKSDGIIKEFRSFAEEKELKQFKKPTDIPIFQKSLWPPLMCAYDVEGKELWESMSVEWKIRGSDYWFIEFNESEKSEQLEEMCQERLHQILLRKEEMQYHCFKNNWQFNNPRRARFASVGLINLM
ncbi:Protein CBG05019 [Caenorhabditis briggsae]|uniref:histone acetyltransferase n=1 Tax=Caenorhabditis briggsae TaxID=6238 RepID=A8WYZ9_CAEBR|nr:Protein CBG05019 [Caenorhabditis briggsae]CAP25608.2 Protein CBG05019 [Caenorhabditis briggsae]